MTITLRYITKDEFIYGQSGVEVEIGPGKCFNSEADLLFFLATIEDMIDNYTCRRWDIVANTDKFWGNESHFYFPRNLPINSVTSLTYDYLGNTTGTQTIDSDDYFVTDNSIQYNEIFKDKIYYTLTYNSGYERDGIPRPIKQAVIELAGLALQETGRGILVSESGLNTKLVYQQTILPLFPQIEKYLSPYKRRFFGW